MRLIGDVRGMGLMLGVELVRDRNQEPASTETVQHWKARTRPLISKGGLSGNVLRIKPPMLTKTDADFLADCLDEVAIGGWRVIGGGWHLESVSGEWLLLISRIVFR